MIPFFKNTDVDIYTYKGLDEYGDKEYVFRKSIEADIQPLSNESSMQIFGKILQDTYNLYISIHSQLNDTDHLLIHNECYEVIGSIEEWNHILNFKKVVIRKLRKKGSV
jgi:hypothetical protein